MSNALLGAIAEGGTTTSVVDAMNAGFSSASSDMMSAAATIIATGLGLFALFFTVKKCMQLFRTVTKG